MEGSGGDFARGREDEMARGFFAMLKKFRNDPCQTVLPKSPVQKTWDGFLP